MDGEKIFAVQRDPKLRILIPLVVAIAFLMEQLDSTIIATAIPDMSRSLSVAPVQMNLAVTAYVVTLAVFIPLSGWFADRFGARHVFIFALGLFTVGSALCGLSTTFAELVLTRVLQGIGGALMTPVGRLVLLRSFPRSDLVTAMTYVTVPAILGPVLGPLLGGVLTTYASWRWIFYVNLPFGAAGIALALRYMEDTRGDAAIRFDFPGFLLVGTGIALLQFGMDNIGRPIVSVPTIVGLLAASAVLLVAFARYAKRVPSPAVDLSLFRVRTFSIGVLAGGLCRIGLNGTPFLLPLMLQVGFGLSPVVSGSLVFLGSGGALTIRVFIKPLLRAGGFRMLLIGSAFASTAILIAFGSIGPTTPHWLIGAIVIVFGVIRATQFIASNMLSYADTPDGRLSQATSLFGAVQQLTVSFGVSVSAILLGLLSGGGSTLTPAQFQEVFWLMALLPLAALPGFWRLRREDGAQVSGWRRA